jgi:hypothetical protein
LKPAEPKQNGEVILARFLSTDFVGARTIPTCTLPLAPPGTAVRRNGARRPNQSVGSEQRPRLRRSLFAKGITDASVFIDRALSGIREFMEADGHEDAFRRLVAPSVSSVQFAKALNRSVTGSMNDLVKLATYMLATGDLSPHDVGFKLNKTPMSALGFKQPLCGMPRNAFEAMVEGGES